MGLKHPYRVLLVLLAAAMLLAVPALADPSSPDVTGTDPASPANNNNPLVQGTADGGTTVHIYDTSDCMGTELASGSDTDFSGGGIQVTVGDDSTTDFYATSDDGVTTSACSSTFAHYVEDSTAPDAPSVNSATDPAGPANNNNPKVSGSGEGDSTIKIYPDSSCTAGTELASGSEGDFESGIATPVNDDSDNNLYATATDQAGNESACSSTFAHYVEDSTAPDAPTISSTPSPPSNQNDLTLHGSAETDSTVAVYDNATCAGTPLATGSAADYNSPGFDASVPDNSDTDYSVTATDTAGNVSACGGPFTYVEDSTAPHIAFTGTDPASPANNNNPKIQGTSDESSTVKLFDNSGCSGPPVATDSSAVFSGAGIPVTVADNTTTDYYARATDAAGNTSACSATHITYEEDSDTTPPSPPTVDPATTPAGPSNSNSPKVTGTAELGSTVRIYDNSGCTGSPVGSGPRALFVTPGPGIAASVPDNSTTDLYATATDRMGNTSGCSTSHATYVEDSTAPIPILTATDPAGTSNVNSVKVKGFSEAGASVRIYSDPGCIGFPLATASEAVFAGAGIPVTVADNSVNDFYARATDPAGNTSACSGSHVTYTEDSMAPAAPTLSVSPASPGTDNTPTVSGSAELGSTVALYKTSNCSGTPVASGTQAQLASPGFTVTVGDNSTTQFSATATDAVGNTSACSPAVTYVESTPAPCSHVIRGTSGIDKLVGTAGSDKIIGYGGKDFILGQAGNDCLYAYAGNDIVKGGAGNDSISGGSGNDTLQGDAGRDSIRGERGNDLIRVRDGIRDKVNCGSGFDNVTADHKDLVNHNCERVRRG